MSTGNTLLAALFCCLTAGEASRNAIPIPTSGVARRPEVPCALNLIPPLFRREKNDSAAYPPRLIVFGISDWLDEFLQRFPSVATVFVFDPTPEHISKFEYLFLAEMMPSASIVLILYNDLDEESSLLSRRITIPVRVRLITWVSFDSNDDADVEMSYVTTRDTCHRFYRHMITARPRGTTHVFSLPMTCDMASESPDDDVEGELLGVWSPGAGWSAPRVPIFPPLCASWRGPLKGEPLRAEMFDITSGGLDSVDTYLSSDEYQVLKLVRESFGLKFRTRVKSTTKVTKPYWAADSCRLGVAAFPVDTIEVDIMYHTELSFFIWEIDKSIGVVHAGAGKPRHVMYPLTAEYTPVVWAALATVVLVVVACLYLMRRDKSVQELVLQTVSPLLGQPLDEGRGGPQIAILGGWLLTCVVVVGAYQGQLLGFITVPFQNREINSWEEWLESDLKLVVDNQTSLSSITNRGLYGVTEGRLFRIHQFAEEFEKPLGKTQTVVMRKRLFKDTVWDGTMHKKEVYFERLRELHTFDVPMTPSFPSRFFTTKGSPFEVPLRKMLGRIHAAGGFRSKLKYKEDPPQVTEDNPITLSNVMPVFAVYIAGNVLAGFTFFLECLQPNQIKFLGNTTHSRKALRSALSQIPYTCPACARVCSCERTLVRTVYSYRSFPDDILSTSRNSQRTPFLVFMS
ncbi:Ionotropic receptor 253 [Frankliniella occidentalis]|nr:Ionotropic receptor 253 [Frankliniella occidentalis]